MLLKIAGNKWDRIWNDMAEGLRRIGARNDASVAQLDQFVLPRLVPSVAFKSVSHVTGTLRVGLIP